MALQLTESRGGLTLSVKVVPGASRDAISGAYGGGIKLTVTRPPHGGQANEAVIDLLAEALALPRANIEIIRGHANPRKQVLLRGISARDVLARLAST